MSTEVILTRSGSALSVPAIVADAGDAAVRRFLEFFTVNIRNPNTRAAYAQAVGQFLRWCEGRIADADRLAARAQTGLMHSPAEASFDRLARRGLYLAVDRRPCQPPVRPITCLGAGGNPAQSRCDSVTTPHQTSPS